MKRLLLCVLLFSVPVLMDTSNAYACGGNDDDPAPPPAAVGEISGPSSVCRGDIYTYRVSVNNPTSSSYTYSWSVGIGQVRNPSTGQFAGTGVPVVITAGSTSSVQVRVSDPTPPDNLAVIAANVTGSGIPSSGRNKLVTVNAETAPSTPSSITENFFPSTTFNNSFTVSAVSGATSYQWETVPATQTRTGRTVSFLFPSSGFYDIRVRAVGCAGTSGYRTIGVFVDDFNNNCQDPFNPQPIFCDEFRAGGDVEDGLASTAIQFNVFPNPLSGNEFTVQVPSNVDNADVIVTDIKGAMVKQLKMNGSKLKVDASGMQ
ncbi:MAG: hypothetical protein WBG62_15500, partial [Cyclobacteriaceae bacterium]